MINNMLKITHEKSVNDAYIIQNGINRMNDEWKNEELLSKTARNSSIRHGIRDGTAS